MVMLLLLVRDLLYIAFGLLLVWVSWMVGSSLGHPTLSSVLEVVVESVESWYASSLDIEEVLAGAADSHVHLLLLMLSSPLTTLIGCFGSCLV